MKVVVLKELPNGEQPGDVIETNDDIANILILVGAGRAVTDDDEPHESPTRRRTYRRRDLVPEGS